MILDLIIGPMFSGKTSKLIQIHKECERNNQKTLVINHHSDTRYHPTKLSNHDLEMIDCHQTGTLRSILLGDNHTGTTTPLLRGVDVLLINEGQFYPDLFETIRSLVMTAPSTSIPSTSILSVQLSRIVISGLDGDFKQEKIGQIVDLIPYANSVEKLRANCGNCLGHNIAIFSKRLSSEKEQIVVGSSNYIPVCRSCL